VKLPQPAVSKQRALHDSRERIPGNEERLFEAQFQPAAHEKTSDAQALAPGSDVLPAGHVVHVADDVAPAVVEYVPAGHCKLAPPGQYEPAAHKEQSGSEGLE
jgi:hypothetical protein